MLTNYRTSTFTWDGNEFKNEREWRNKENKMANEFIWIVESERERKQQNENKT